MPLSTPDVWYRCDEASGNLIDQMGVYDATDNGTIGSTSGVISGARSFNGSTQYGRVTNPSIVNYAPLSVTLWCHLNSLSANTSLFGRWHANGPGGDLLGWLILVTVSGSAFFLCRDNVSGLVFYAETPTGLVTTGSTYHLAAKMDSGTSISIWVNGTKYTPSTSAFGAPYAGEDLSIGSGLNNSSIADPLNGWLDLIGAYSYDFSDADVATLWNGGAGFDPTAPAGVVIPVFMARARQMVA